MNLGVYQNLFGIENCFFLDDHKTAQHYSSQAARRGNAIRDVFWNDSLAMWRDFDLRHGQQRSDFYMSSLTPLFAACSPDNMDVMSPEFLRRVASSPDVSAFLIYSFFLSPQSHFIGKRER